MDRNASPSKKPVKSQVSPGVQTRLIAKKGASYSLLLRLAERKGFEPLWLLTKRFSRPPRYDRFDTSPYPDCDSFYIISLRISVVKKKFPHAGSSAKTQKPRRLHFGRAPRLAYNYPSMLFAQFADPDSHLGSQCAKLRIKRGRSKYHPKGRSCLCTRPLGS